GLCQWLAAGEAGLRRQLRGAGHPRLPPAARDRDARRAAVGGGAVLPAGLLHRPRPPSSGCAVPGRGAVMGPAGLPPGWEGATVGLQEMLDAAGIELACPAESPTDPA